MLILVCNVGSTSLKMKVFNMPQDESLADLKIERIGSPDSLFYYRNHQKDREQSLTLAIHNFTQGIRMFLERIADPGLGIVDYLDDIAIIGFKTVMSKGYAGIHELTEKVIAGMEDYRLVAPAHSPPYIEAIREFQKVLPTKKMIGVFETNFHTTIPQKAKIYGIPYRWYEEFGFERLGFHGASHSYIASCIKKREGEKSRLISCHLGGSSSICAILDGKSVDISFGFSPQSGLPHMNRVGDMDVYMIAYLLQNRGYSLEQVLNGLQKEGGLYGISGVSNDLRDIEAAAAQGNKQAQLAIDVFCYSIVKYIGSYFAIMGGLDHICFTGGIGEKSPTVRGKVCDMLRHLGVELDADANSAGRADRLISTAESPVKVHIIPANEEVGIARNIYDTENKTQNKIVTL